MACGFAKVQTGIISLILERMGQVRCPLASMQKIDIDKMVH
jgi:hypothetical protein